MTIKDNGAYGLIAVQGSGRIGKHAPADAGDDPLRRADRGRSLRQPRRGRATAWSFENTGTEPLVTLRYFGPDANPRCAERRRSQEDGVDQARGLATSVRIRVS